MQSVQYAYYLHMRGDRSQDLVFVPRVVPGQPVGADHMPTLPDHLLTR